MNFLQYELGYQEKGNVVEVTLDGDACNVSLMDSGDFYDYSRGRSHNYYGGYVTRSPFRIAIPYSATWYVAIDFGGYEGSTRASVRVLSGY